MARGKIHDGGQEGSWEVGSEAVSWSERDEQMGKGREKHGGNITERCEERVWSLGYPREQQQRDGLLQGDTAEAWTTDSQWVCFLWKTYFSGGGHVFPLPH